MSARLAIPKSIRIRHRYLLGLRLKGLYEKVPANVIDESIDEALITRKNVMQKNLEAVKKSSLSFKSKKIYIKQ